MSPSSPSLASLTIREAVGGVLDLRAVTGDATVHIDRWPLMNVGQKVWIECTGTSGSAPSQTSLLNGAPVTAADVADGVNAALPIDFLRRLDGNTALDVRASVTFDGSSDKSGSTALPTYTVTVR